MCSLCYLVNTKVGTIAGGTYKCNFDVEIAMDVLKVAYQMKPDIIVLATGDADFVPLIQEVRKSGIRVEIAAFEETIGAELLLKCSGFIDLAVYYDDFLAAQKSVEHEENREEVYQDLIQSQVQAVYEGLEDVAHTITGQDDEKTNVSLENMVHDEKSNDALNVLISSDEGEETHGNH